MKKVVWIIGSTVVVAIAVLVGLWLVGVFEGNGELVHITAVMPYIPNSEWTGFYAASIQGYYEDEGLDVEFIYTTEGGFGAIKQVVAGEADVGYAASDSVILGRSQGLPVVAVYQPEKNNQFCLIVKTDRGFKGPGDLAGSTIAITGAGGPVHIAALAMLTDASVDTDTISFVPVGAELIPALTEGRADAIAGYLFSDVMLEGMGVDVQIWYTDDYIGNYAVTSVITSEEMIAAGNDEGRDAVSRFVRATDRGWKYAIENPETAVDQYIETFAPEAEAYRDVEVEYWNRLVSDVYEGNDLATLGDIEETTWIRAEEILYDLGIIDVHVDPASAYSTDFLP